MVIGPSSRGFSRASSAEYPVAEVLIKRQWEKKAKKKCMRDGISGSVVYSNPTVFIRTVAMMNIASGSERLSDVSRMCVR